jgi:hypothetical protein
VNCGEGIVVGTEVLTVVGISGVGCTAGAFVVAAVEGTLTEINGFCS